MSAPAVEPRRRPPWMSIPGGPKEPSLATFLADVRALNAERTAIFAQLKDISDRFGPRADDADREAARSERRALGDRMKDIDAERQRERAARMKKNDELTRVRKSRQEIQGKLKALSGEVGAFESISEIDEAIDLIMMKLETGDGSLANEKRTVKRLAKLEEAKGLLLQLEPLQEAIDAADEREALLQQDYRDIHDNISKLNKAFEEQVAVRQHLNEHSKQNDVDRTALIAERQKCRERLTELNDKINALRETFDSDKKKWNEWREIAQAKYAEKVENERKERQKRWLEIQNAEKIAQKKARAAKRMNPYETEINVCTTLIRYLKDRLLLTKRDEEDRKRRAALATFDAAASAPEGFAVMDPTFSAKGKGKSAKPQKAPKTDKVPERLIQHNEAKIQQFARVGVAAPMSTSAIEKSIEALNEKLKEYQSHVQTGDLVLSSDDEEENEEKPSETPAKEEAAEGNDETA